MAKKAAAKKKKPAAKPAAQAAAATKPAGYSRKVRATKMGYYDNKRRRIGDVFTIDDPKAFSENWMEDADPNAVERTTTPNEALRQQHDEILGNKNATALPGSSATPGTGNADPIGD